MAESEPILETKPGEHSRYLREQYTPKRQEAEQTLFDSGMSPDNPLFRKTRAKVARKYYEKEQEGEIDHLTDLLNRKGFERRLREETERAKRSYAPLSVLYLDLNKVKETNDTHGHGAGDELLKRTTTILKESVRPFDIIARLGGDEFAIVLTGVDTEIAKVLWQRMNEKFEHPVDDNQQQEEPISIAAGLSPIDPEHVEESIDLADKAMYKSKRITKEAGKNTLVSIEDLTNEEILR